MTPSTLRADLGARSAAILPGLLLCVAVTGAAMLLARLEEAVFGRAWIESLVLAILVGTAVRTAWAPPKVVQAGVAFCAKPVLEVAVVLLGASLSAATVAEAGLWLLVGIAVVVAIALAAGFGIGRFLGLGRRISVLIACGNAICGNSAIAAVAPVIGATAADVAASIAFTAVLGVIVVIALPLAGVALQMSQLQYGTLAGLTVYAVPQVLAATAPMGAVAVQIGTLVKLVRVLMLGPVCVGLSIVMGRQVAGPRKFSLNRFVPWFIIGFLALATARSLGVIPESLVPLTARTAGVLTIVAMAALGLGVDVRVVARAGVRVTMAVCGSLLTLAGVSVILIRLLGVA
jgi:uncharacterized integral membrane protein (TIGR00698 family)